MFCFPISRSNEAQQQQDQMKGNFINVSFATCNEEEKQKTGDEYDVTLPTRIEMSVLRTSPRTQTSHHEDGNRLKFSLVQLRRTKRLRVVDRFIQHFGEV